MKPNRTTGLTRWNTRCNSGVLFVAFAAGIAVAGARYAESAAPAAPVEVAARVLHDTMETRIGHPAVIRPGDDVENLLPF